MRASTEHPKARRHPIATGLAPHVDPRWAEDFVIELRLLGVQGARIGDALSEVESHCEESGENATQAFGDPADYARNLQLPPQSDTSPRALLLFASPTFLQCLAMSLLLWSFDAWLSHEQLGITIAHIVTVVAFLVGASLLVRFSERVLRLFAHHPLIMGIFLMTWVAVLATSFRLLDDVIWRVSTPWTLAAGAVAMIVGTVWMFASLRARGTDDGPITSPLENAGTSSRRQAPGLVRSLTASSRLGSLLFMAQIPVATVILLGTTLMLHK
jgi:hypothetical protein